MLPFVGATFSALNNRNLVPNPTSQHDDDILVGLGIEWRYLLPLLTKCGLLRSKVTSVVKDVHVDVTQWHEMTRAIARSLQMEVACIRTQYSRRSYFFCVGDPLFKNPLYQARESSFVSLRRDSLPSRDFLIEAKKTATEIINERLAIRVHGGNVNAQKVTSWQ